jgi:hypothetical protein
MRHTFRSMISRFFASSSFFDGSSSFVSVGFASSGGGGISAAFSPVPVDCHRWKSRGDSGLKLDGWMGPLDSSNLELEDGVDNDLENVGDVKARLCLISVRRIMI